MALPGSPFAPCWGSSEAFAASMALRAFSRDSARAMACGIRSSRSVISKGTCCWEPPNWTVSFSFSTASSGSRAPTGAVAFPETLPPITIGNSVPLRSFTSLGQTSRCSISQAKGSGFGVASGVGVGVGVASGVGVGVGVASGVGVGVGVGVGAGVGVGVGAGAGLKSRFAF